MSSTKYYAGIGARKTPPEICAKMTQIASFLERQGYTLRSGGAEGADIAFEIGVNIAGLHSHIYTVDNYTSASLEHAAKYHPVWDDLSHYEKRLMGRNSIILLGEELDTPVEFVVCWTYKGIITGGTGQGLRIAIAYDIPIINLATQEFPYDLF
jgi:hypothetical protein